VCARIDYLVLLVLSDSPQQIANQNDAHFKPRSLRTVTLKQISGFPDGGKGKSTNKNTPGLPLLITNRVLGEFLSILLQQWEFEQSLGLEQGGLPLLCHLLWD
jgi:hypothetical protein